MGAIVEGILIQKDPIKYIKDLYQDLLNINRKNTKLEQILAMKVCFLLNMSRYNEDLNFRIQYISHFDNEEEKEIYEDTGIVLGLCNGRFYDKAVRYIVEKGNNTQKKDLDKLIKELGRKSLN